MIKSNLALVNGLSALLFDVVHISNLVQRKDHAAYQQLLNWIHQSETLLQAHRLPACAEMAGIKGRLLAPQFDTDRRVKTRKLCLQLTAENLYALQDCLQRILEPRQHIVDSARSTLRQYLAMLADANAVTLQHGEDIELFCKRIWHLIVSHEQLKGSAVQLLSELQQAEIICLLVEEIDLAQFRGC